jgi:phospholipid/cholesterol/gamma-HCH transport system ATP-binding protein
MESQNPTVNNQSPVAIARLRKSFGQQKVLNGIDLTVTGGEILAVLGRSGTGKSVLLKLLIGLQKPDDGSVLILGQEITHFEMDQLNEVRKKMGFLFQDAALYDSLTIEENVAFPLRRHAQLAGTELRDRVKELLASVELDRDLDKMPSEISGGMRKRVGLARAIALNPEILLLDEPTAGLDPITATEIGTLISKLKTDRKITAIVVTHDIHSARSMADRLVMLEQGNILIDGTFDELRKSRDQFVTQFLKDAA